MWSEALAFLQVILIDISLSGDNAIVIGMAAAGLAAHLRKQALAIGIMCAVLLRLVFSVVTVHLLAFPALAFIGGVLLLWVCWKMFQDLIFAEDNKDAGEGKNTLWLAVLQIIIADVSMSLDNVLAVASASREHVWIMVFGLVLSIGLMAVAANLVVGLLKRWPWLNWLGLAIILYVALSMMWHSWPSVLHLFA